MALTEEQKERIKKNRERALEIQRKRQRDEEQEQNQHGEESVVIPTESLSEQGNRKKQNVSSSASEGGKEGDANVNGQETGGEDDVDLEEFEIGASDLVTKKEAMKVYLLPEGTLAVCQYEEKQNPHNKGFAPMKLYHRSEVRRRSRERFGGLQGLVEERRRREEKRFQKDLQATKDIFR